MSGTEAAAAGKQAPVTFLGLEALRLFACSLIVLYHAHSMIRSVPKPDGSMVGDPDVGWHFALDIFFVMSGFLAVAMGRGLFGISGAPKFFIIRRLIRIVPLYWIFTALFAGLFLVAAGNSHGSDFVTVERFFASLFFVPVPDGPIVPLGWTLNYEMYFYTLFALSLFFGYGRGVAFLLIVIFGSVLASLAIPVNAYAVTFWAGPLMLDFAWGIIIAVLYLQGLRLPLLLCVVFGLAAFYPLSLADHFFETFDPLRPLTLGLGSALFVAASVFPRGQASLGSAGKMIGQLDKSVFSVYLTHVLTLKALQMIYVRLGLADDYGPIPFIVFASIIAFTAGFIFYRLVDKPLTSYLNRRLM